jgi:RimJ/RimL family protein N-acetyltransferase
MIRWAAAQLGGRYRDDARAIGVERDGELRAVVVFDTWSRRNCHISVVSRSGSMWMTRQLARAVSTYVFVTGGLARVTCHIPESNTEARRFAEQLGMQIEGRQREGAPDGDVIVYGLLRRECRWVPRGLALSLAKPPC